MPAARCKRHQIEGRDQHRPHTAPLKVIEVLNPNITPKDLAGQFIVLDIQVEDDQSFSYNIEMQVRRHKAYSDRSTYYVANTLIGQLGGEQDDHQIKGVIGIHLLDYDSNDLLLCPGAFQSDVECMPVTWERCPCSHKSHIPVLCNIRLECQSTTACKVNCFAVTRISFMRPCPGNTLSEIVTNPARSNSTTSRFTALRSRCKRSEI